MLDIPECQAYSLSMTAKRDPATVAALAIIARAQKAVGKMWDRMTPDGRIVECRSILCCDMLNKAAADAPNAWWQSVHGAIIVAIYPVEDQTE